MSGVNYFNLIETDTKLEGFSTKISELIFGDLTLNQRLKSQLKKLNLNYQINSKSQDSIPISDDAVYSDSLLLALSKNFKKYLDKKIIVETTLNSSIVHANTKIQNQILNFNGAESIQISQDNIFSVDLRLPETMYPEKNYQVIAPSLYYQKIESWPDLIKAQSLIARDFTIKAVLFWQTFMPKSLMIFLFNHPRLTSKANQIGKNCRIHHTAILESCVIGDNVEIGAYCYLRAAVVGSNATIREKSSIKLSVIGAGAYILPTDIFNCYIGPNVTITTSILFHSAIAESTFIGGGVGFADLNATKSNIQITNAGKGSDSEQMFLGSCIAEHCFIGAGLLFQVATLVQHHTTILNHSMISKKDFIAEKIYISKNAKLTQIPKSFLSAKASD